MGMSLSQLRELAMDREAWRAVWFMGSQKVEDDLATELNWTDIWMQSTALLFWTRTSCAPEPHLLCLEFCPACLRTLTLVQIFTKMPFDLLKLFFAVLLKWQFVPFLIFLPYICHHIICDLFYMCVVVCVCVHVRLAMSNPLWPFGLLPTRLLCWWHFPGKKTGVGHHFLL